MKRMFVEKRFNASSMALIQHANEIIEEYTRAGFTLTLRQLYYQFVSRDLLPNTVKSYGRLGDVMNDARLAGLVDWNALEDRTRFIRALSHWSDPKSILGSCAWSYRIDKWFNQPHRVEVWIEKDALVSVFEDVCNKLDVPLLSCRGYVSLSEMWASFRRMSGRQETIVLHFGDHDPSGIDMTRDIGERLRIFGASVEIRRVALNMDQVEQYSPPPNPAKVTDSRFESYREEFGEESWELDALTPQVLADLVTDRVHEIRDQTLWDEACEREAKEKELLQTVHDRWEDIKRRIEEDDL